MYRSLVLIWARSHWRPARRAARDSFTPPSGSYVIRETKASTFPLKKDKVTPGDAQEHHLDDLTIQAWVYQVSGLRLAGAELNLLDNQENFALRSGLARSYFSGIERDRRNLAALNLIRIATALGCEVGEIFPKISELNPRIQRGPRK